MDEAILFKGKRQISNFLTSKKRAGPAVSGELSRGLVSSHPKGLGRTGCAWRGGHRVSPTDRDGMVADCPPAPSSRVDPGGAP